MKIEDLCSMPDSVNKMLDDFIGDKNSPVQSTLKPSLKKPEDTVKKLTGTVAKKLSFMDDPSRSAVSLAAAALKKAPKSSKSVSKGDEAEMRQLVKTLSSAQRAAFRKMLTSTLPPLEESSPEEPETARENELVLTSMQSEVCHPSARVGWDIPEIFTFPPFTFHSYSNSRSLAFLLHHLFLLSLLLRTPFPLLLHLPLLPRLLHHLPPSPSPTPSPSPSPTPTPTTIPLPFSTSTYTRFSKASDPLRGSPYRPGMPSSLPVRPAHLACPFGQSIGHPTGLF
jgi:hypothetical protein